MLKNEIIRAIDSLDENTLCDLYREWCFCANYPDDEIFSMVDFNDIMDGQDAEWIACRVFYGDFCPAHDYFRFNGYGNLESTDYPSDWIDAEELADWIVDGGMDVLPDYLADLFEEEPPAEVEDSIQQAGLGLLASLPLYDD